MTAAVGIETGPATSALLDGTGRAVKCSWGGAGERVRLVRGRYGFLVSVTDAKGLSASDEVVVDVRQPMLLG